MATEMRPSLSEINAMRKDDLKNALIELLHKEKEKDPGESSNNSVQADAEPEKSGGEISALLKEILAEIKKGNDERREIRSELDSMKEANKALKDTVVSQQKFMMSLDYNQRKCNLIISGLKKIRQETTLTKSKMSYQRSGMMKSI